MRTITLRYAGECRKCAAPLAVGAEAVYEKRVGVFCPTCAPTDPEEIRAVRQEAANRKADRYDEWAHKRRVRAGAVLKSIEPYTTDHAFNTQPGHIPLRTRIIAREDRAFESLDIAAGMAAKAASLRSGVRVAGDAERRREERRAVTRLWIAKGQSVYCSIYRDAVVVRVNKKTATVPTESGFQVNVDLSWLRLAETVTTRAEETAS